MLPLSLNNGPRPPSWVSVASTNLPQVPPSLTNTAPSSTPPQELGIFREIRALLAQNKPYRISLAKLIVHVMTGRAIDTIDDRSEEYDLANKWVRNACEKIYEDPLRAVLEIVKNGCDAILPPNKATGFFGIGFLTFLHLLYYRTAAIPGITKVKICSGDLGVSLKYKKGEIHLKFQTIPNQKGTTRIHLIDTYFQEEDLEKLLKYCSYIRFHSECKTKVKVYDLDYEFGKKGKNIPEVNVELNKDFITVSNAGEISLETIVTKLLIPGVTTHIPPKKFAHLKAECFESHDKIDSKKVSKFILVCNQVIITEIPLPDPLNNRCSDFCVSLPYCDITTAGNEVLINRGSYEESLFFKLIQSVVSNAGQNSKTLNYLYVCLHAWEQQSHSDEIRGRFTNYLKKTFKEWLIKNPSYIAVDIKNQDFYKVLLPTSVQLVPASPDLFDYNLAPLEKAVLEYFRTSYRSSAFLRDCLEGKVIEGTYLCFVADIFIPGNANGSLVPIKLDLINVLFCPLSYIKTYPNKESLSENLCMLLPELKIYEEKPKKERYAGIRNYFIKKAFQSIGAANKPDMSNFEKHMFNDHDLCVVLMKHFNFIKSVPQKDLGKLLEIFINGFYAHQTNLTSHPMNENEAKELLVQTTLKFVRSQKKLHKLRKEEICLMLRNKFSNPWINNKGSIEVIDYEKWAKFIRNLRKEIFAEDSELQIVELIRTKLSDNNLFKTVNPSPLINTMVMYVLASLKMISKNKINAVQMANFHLPMEELLFDVAKETRQDPSAFITDGSELIWSPTIELSTFSQLIKLLSLTSLTRSFLLIGKDETVIREFPYSSSVTFTIFKAQYAPLMVIENHLFELERSNFIIPQNAFSEIVSFVLKFCVMEDALSIKCKIHVRRFVESYLYILDSVLRFDITSASQAIATVSKKFQLVMEPSNELMDHLNSTIDHPELLVEFMDKTLCHWSKTAHLDRSSDPGSKLRNDELVLPNFQFSPLGLFIKLLTKKVNVAAIKIIVNRCTSIAELCLVLKLLLEFVEREGASSFICDEKVNTDQLAKMLVALEAYIDIYIHGKLSQGDIEHWYKSHLKESKNQYYRNFSVYLLNSVAQLRVKEENTKSFSIDPKAISFSLKQLTRAFFLNPSISHQLKRGEISNVVTEVSSCKSIESFSRVTQCVQNTTSRSYVRALIIEWLQNSRDAYCARANVQKKIIFGLSIVKNTLKLSVRDFAGFSNPSNLLNFHITDKSDKDKANSKLVGQMGNGVFIMYQLAQKVVLTTRFTEIDKIIMATIVPIRDPETLNVIDLQIRWNELPPFSSPIQQEQGTLIEVYTLSQNEERLFSDYLHAKQIITETLGMTALDQDYEIILNSNNERMSLMAKVKKTFYDNKISILQVDQNHASYVNVQGIPFVSMRTFNEKHRLIPPNFMEELSYGIVVNLPEDFYKPLQNRTEVILTDEQKKKIRFAFLSAYYKKQLFEDEFNNFSHAKSTSYIHSLHSLNILPYPDFIQDMDKACEKQQNCNNEVFMAHFSPEFLTDIANNLHLRTFQGGVSRAIDMLNDEFAAFKNRFLKEFEDIKQEIQEHFLRGTLDKTAKEQFIVRLLALHTQYKNIYNFSVVEKSLNAFVTSITENISADGSAVIIKFYKKYILRWLEQKTHFGGLPYSDRETLFQLIPDLRETSIQPKLAGPVLSFSAIINRIKNVFNLSEACLKAYCKLYLEILKYHFPESKIEFKASYSSNRLGSFYPSANLISFNLAEPATIKIFQVLLSIAQGNIKKALEQMKGYFIPTRTFSGVINHELEHKLQFFRNSNSIKCDRGHGMVLNHKNKLMMFEASALYSATLAREGKLIQRWIKECESIFHANSSLDTPVLFSQFIKALEDPETKAWMFGEPLLNLQEV